MVNNPRLSNPIAAQPSVSNGDAGEPITMEAGPRSGHVRFRLITAACRRGWSVMAPVPCRILKPPCTALAWEPPWMVLERLETWFPAQRASSFPLLLHFPDGPPRFLQMPSCPVAGRPNVGHVESLSMCPPHRPAPWPPRKNPCGRSGGGPSSSGGMPECINDHPRPRAPPPNHEKQGGRRCGGFSPVRHCTNWSHSLATMSTCSSENSACGFMKAETSAGTVMNCPPAPRMEMRMFFGSRR